MYYYMGLVKLPSKRDYWHSGPNSIWPSHVPVLSISRAKYEYIWRNIHLVRNTTPDDEEDIDEDEDPEEDLTGDAEDDEEEDEEEEREDDIPRQLPPETEEWYEKARLLLDHIMAVSRRICKKPGSRLSIDEMMKLFKGRSGETHRMKNKPIKEGYKFFALCDALTGFVYEMLPNGRLQNTTTHDTVLSLVGMIPGVGTNDNYVVAMDNYFTWAKVMTSLTEIGVGAIGTTRFERGWSPKEVRAVKDDRFNTLHTLNDKGKFMIGRWVDNNVVNLVTNVHTGEETIEREWKKPWKTATN
jgi:hypothetical protein